MSFMPLETLTNVVQTCKQLYNISKEERFWQLKIDQDYKGYLEKKPVNTSSYKYYQKIWSAKTISSSEYGQGNLLFTEPVEVCTNVDYYYVTMGQGAIVVLDIFGNIKYYIEQNTTFKEILLTNGIEKMVYRNGTMYTLDYDKKFCKFNSDLHLLEKIDDNVSNLEIDHSIIAYIKDNELKAMVGSDEHFESIAQDVKSFSISTGNDGESKTRACATMEYYSSEEEDTDEKQWFDNFALTIRHNNK